MSLFLNGVETNTVMLNGVDTTGVWNGEVVWGVPPFKTLTLYHSEGGTLTANELTGYPGDTINLSTAYNTYWRFSGYQWTGDGTLANNTYTFGTEDASICACYKVNAFTATGGWEKGSNVTVTAPKNSTNMGSYRGYAIRNASTGEIPSNWYSTSNRWNPSNASAYKITLNPRGRISLKSGNNGGMKLTGSWATIIGSTYTNTASNNITGRNKSLNVDYNKTITSNSQTTYSISALLINQHVGYTQGIGTAQYIASYTTGTWTATGYAP